MLGSSAEMGQLISTETHREEGQSRVVDEADEELNADESEAGADEGALYIEGMGKESEIEAMADLGTEDEVLEECEELMNAAEKAVLEEMRREIEKMAQQRNQEGPDEADDAYYMNLPDGELLKFLRARRYVLEHSEENGLMLFTLF